MKTFMQSTTTPTTRFQVLSYDRETGLMKLQGKYSTFEETIPFAELKGWMEKFKYQLVKAEE